jgi:hypothetical protein
MASGAAQVSRKVPQVEPALNLNSYMAVLKRPTPTLPPPVETAPGWSEDPSGRYQQRYWNGIRWTEHVSTAGTTATDTPDVR